MAQYLDLNPAQASKNDRVAFTDTTLAGDFLVRCRCELYNHTTVPAGMLFSGGNSGGGVEIYRNGSLGVQLFINGTSVGTAGNLWPYTNDVDINPRYVDLRRVGSTLTVEFDGVVAITVSNSATLKINSIGSRGTGLYLGFKLYDLEITNGAFYRKYDASLAGSTGTILATNDGVNQGTISGGAAYVAYDGGEPEPSSYTSNISASIPLFGLSAEQISNAPNYSSDASFGVQLFGVGLSQQSSVPSYDSSIAFGVSMFGASAAQEYSSPNGGSSIGFSVPLFGVSSSYKATAPQYTMQAEYGVELFGVSANQSFALPSEGVSVSVGVQMFGVLASQSATVPQYIMESSVGIPMFSVFSLSGEFNYVAADGGKIDLPAQSRLLDIAAQSRRIDL